MRGGSTSSSASSRISYGTLRLLAFITALSLESLLVAFEEPLVRKSGKQVIISIYSPHLPDHMKPDEVLLVVKVKGETRIRRLTDTREVMRVKKLLEEGAH